jgi:hypothetical protein
MAPVRRYRARKGQRHLPGSLARRLAATDRTNTVAAWLDSASAGVLRGLDAGDQVTHAALDELPDGKPVEHLRSVLVAIGDPGGSPWLFPGGRPGRALSAFRMAERLNQLGIHCARSRSAALFQLATELPAAVLAKMLGIHIAVAVSWQRARAGDWTAYAAEVSRRSQPTRSPSR